MEPKSVKERFDTIKDGLDEIFRELNLIFSKLASKEIDVREEKDAKGSRIQTEDFGGRSQATKEVCEKQCKSIKIKRVSFHETLHWL